MMMICSSVFGGCLKLSVFFHEFLDAGKVVIMYRRKM
jgi:hypothetical protein